MMDDENHRCSLASFRVCWPVRVWPFQWRAGAGFEVLELGHIQQISIVNHAWMKL